MRKAFFNGTIFTSEEIWQRKAVLTNNHFIESVVNENEIPENYEKIDLHGYNLAPALIDLQIYGGNGKLFSMYPSVEAISATYDYCKNGGAAWFQPTVATNSLQKMEAAIDAVKDYRKQQLPGVIGLHLEGPYINPIKRGAHLTPFIHQPTTDEVKKLLDRAEGILTMMTLAPEMCDDAVIQLLLDSKVIVSAGHSNATYAEAMHGFDDCHIPVATHLFNAMSPLQSRAPGLVGAIYDHDAAKCSMVADGIHVDFNAIRISKKIMGERLFLITDAVEENAAGEYIYIRTNDRYVKDDGTLAGSLLTMMSAVKNCVEKIHIPLDEALRMASLYPAQVMKSDDKKGKVKKGYCAEFVVFDDDLNVMETIFA
jgi:N-acetylglucosamine-6-phosphate deacetylase